jgi:antitoxin HigA-1
MLATTQYRYGHTTMPMKSPPHLGGFVRREILEPLGLSVTDAAAALDVTRQALSNLVNEKAALTADMALRLEKAFGVSMELLMRMQLAYDVAGARARERTIKVKRYKPGGSRAQA